MRQQVSDIMDLVVLALFIGFCMTLGVSSVIKSNHELNAYDATYEDKTSFTRYTLASKVYGLNDGSMTSDELILMTQIQDENIIYDRTINFCQTEEISSLSSVGPNDVITNGKKNQETGKIESWYRHTIQNTIKMHSLYKENLPEYASYAKQFIAGDSTKVSYVVDYNYKTNQYDIHKQYN